MTPEEAQQAQTIAEIKAIRNGGEYPREYYREAIDKAIKIVDSQAQNIAEQAKEIERIKREFEGFKDGVGWRPPEPEQTTDSKEVV